MYKKFHVFLTLLGIIFSNISASQTFVKQSYVDSIYNSVLYDLNAVSDPSSDKTMASVVIDAKNTIKYLRSIANNGINQKYILLKVNELESQIYLEEHGLLIEKGLWNTQTSNQIISDFNTELDKDQPNFDFLNELLAKLSSISPEKSSSMEHSIKNRAIALSGILQQKLKLQLETGKLDSVSINLSYCQKYAAPLGLSKSVIAQFEAKLLTKMTFSESIKSIKSNLDSLKICIENNQFKNAHKIESFLEYQISMSKREIISIEWNNLLKESLLLNHKLASKEDSCINKVLKMLKANQISEADDYIDTISKKGIDPSKIAKINKMLLDKVILQRNNGTYNNIYSIDEDTTQTSPIFNDLIRAAKARALAQRDSISKEKQQNISLTSVAEIRCSRLTLSRALQQKRIEARENIDSQDAFDKLVQIFEFIEKNNVPKAREYFNRYKKEFEKFLSNDDFKDIISLLDSVNPPMDSLNSK